MRFSLCLSVAAASAAVASVLPDTHVLHERRIHHTYLPKLAKRDAVHPKVSLPMRVGLKQSNADQGHEWLMEVTDPASEKYGKFWSAEDVVDKFQPAKETVDTVLDWLVTKGGIAKSRITHADNKAWLAFDATSEEAEALLKTKFHQYEHQSSGDMYLGCDEYYVPQHIQPHIDYITPGVKGVKIERGLQKRSHKKGPIKPKPFKHPSPIMPKNNTALETCDIAITPACLRALYNYEQPDPRIPVSKSNSLGIFEEGDYYSQPDLDSFFTNFTHSYKTIPNGTHPILDSVDGGQAPVPVADAGGESDLDFELAFPIVYPQTVTLYQTDDSFYAQGGSDTATGIFNTFFDAIDGSYCTYCAFGECGDDPVLDPTYPDPSNATGAYKGQLQCGVFKPTNVISISYGEQEQDLPAYYQQRQCNEFLKLGLQGVSIFVASGDTGVGGIPGDGSANGCLGPNATIFSPTQPNSCPYLTNVGATKVYPGKTVFEPESAANDPAGQPYRRAYSSGGGFSNIFTVPDYQKAAVSTYFQQHNPPYPYYFNGQYNTTTNGLYNRNGRGIPDVAANGDNIATYVGGDFTLEGGTSASSPIFASLVNRIVEERIRRGKGPVGFINPVLYQNPQVLNDITNGSNPGCGTNGFDAVKGWDPVTGLGTPNYPKMLDLFLSLP